ncbi:VOC family protein [Kribbella caucasensis]|uniref:VOC family protein n=1 Tax=Kribbella caucasensis TaxID=2512215 RepID=UPI0010605F5D|nr:VOC family protein [Kribbella sp. VKM Ac-2527]
MSDSIKLSGIAINCPDAAELAASYAEITGGRVIYTDPVWAVVDGAGGSLCLQTIPDHTPPTWPDPTVPNQTHLDLAACLARRLARVMRKR